MNEEYAEWEKFVGEEIPSSLELNPIIFKYIKEYDKIIDIGCGFGKVSIQVALKGFFVEGIDINRSGIETAKRAAKMLDIEEQLKFKVADATELPYDDERFDIAIMQALLTAIVDKEDRNKIMKETYRILRPMGCLYIAEFGQTWHSKLYRERYLKGLSITKEEGSFLANNGETGGVDYIAHHFTEKELVFLLVNNGFEIDFFEVREFKTRSGNKVNGYSIIAKKNPVSE